MHDKPADYWYKVASKNFYEVPYKPNPLKYSYLLSNEYPELSNLSKKMNGGKSESRCDTPALPDKDEASRSPGLRNNNFGYKRGDAIGVLARRPTNSERQMNVGLFGSGGGNFDTHGNMWNRQAGTIEQSPALSGGGGNKKHGSLLGDMTLYRVNKEFENF